MLSHHRPLSLLPIFLAAIIRVWFTQNILKLQKILLRCEYTTLHFYNLPRQIGFVFVLSSRNLHPVEEPQKMKLHQLTQSLPQGLYPWDCHWQKPYRSKKSEMWNTKGLGEYSTFWTMQKGTWVNPNSFFKFSLSSSAIKRCVIFSHVLHK